MIGEMRLFWLVLWALFFYGVFCLGVALISGAAWPAVFVGGCLPLPVFLTIRARIKRYQRRKGDMV